MQRRRDPLAVFQFALEIVAHGCRKRRIVDAQHDFHVDEQASEIEVCRAHVYDVVDDGELRVQLRRLIFVHFDPAPKQARIGVAGGRDGRIIVRLRRCDDPRPARPRDPAKPAEEGPGRREISGDEVELAGRAQLAGKRRR
jgi:hypothetical protein